MTSDSMTPGSTIPGSLTPGGWDDFEQRVSCEESLHADCEPLAWPPSQAQLQQLSDRNANTLAAIAALRNAVPIPARTTAR